MPELLRANPPVSATVGDSSDLDELLTVQDVATLLKVHPSWVYEHTRSRAGSRSDRLRRIKLGKYVRFDPREVRDFIARRAKLG
jgi:predicted DNA-binding transcriptional regulator AlpA